MKKIQWLVCLTLLTMPLISYADIAGIPALTLTTEKDGGETYSVTLQILMAMTLLSILPAVVMLTTSFTRIIIVLGMLRQAIGMPQTPTNQVLIGLAIFLSIFVMGPVFTEVNDKALQPYLQETINAKQALNRAQKPFKAFMMHQTRTSDMDVFAALAGYTEVKDYNKLPMTVIIPAFVTSELKTAFQIGFLLFLPFLVIDLVVASTLMSMGMMMLSPLIISLPFKVMLFVLVDGWTLVIGTLASSFGM